MVVVAIVVVMADVVGVLRSGGTEVVLVVVVGKLRID